MIVLVSMSACGSHATRNAKAERVAIAKAMRAYGFAQWGSIFPAHAGTKSCSWGSGAPGNVFTGKCTTRVTLRRRGTSTVLFTEDFGIQGARHSWLVLVEPRRPARVITQSGAAPVQVLP
jgi:hypothetical protein